MHIRDRCPIPGPTKDWSLDFHFFMGINHPSGSLALIRYLNWLRLAIKRKRISPGHDNDPARGLLLALLPIKVFSTAGLFPLL